VNLSELARPWTDVDAEIPWMQRAAYRKPLIATRVEELTARIWLTTTKVTSTLRLWDPEYETLNVRDVLAGLQMPTETYSLALSPVSRTPIEDGYLECMHLVVSSDGIAADVAIAAFARSQLDRYGEMERHLVDCYGTLTPERDGDPRFRTIDYPAFDLGSVKLGLGIFAENAAFQHASIWCWSRVVNWHK
jgi:hypothetical protein